MSKILFEKAKKLISEKDYTMAIVTFSEILESGKIEFNAHYYLAICYANLNYFKETLEEIDLAFKEVLTEKEEEQLLNLKGFVYFKLNDLDNALNVYQENLKKNNENIIAKSGIAFYYFLNKDYEKSLKYYKEIYDQYPDNPKNKNNYGYLLMMNKGDLKKAVNLCEDALKSEPDNPAINDSIAWGNFLLKNLRNAVLYVINAFKKAPYIEEIKEHYNVIADNIRKFLKKS